MLVSELEVKKVQNLFFVSEGKLEQTVQDQDRVGYVGACGCVAGCEDGRVG